jgi:hypothetical protein
MSKWRPASRRGGEEKRPVSGSQDRMAGRPPGPFPPELQDELHDGASGGGTTSRRGGEEERHRVQEGPEKGGGRELRPALEHSGA